MKYMQNAISLDEHFGNFKGTYINCVDFPLSRKESTVTHSEQPSEIGQRDTRSSFAMRGYI